MVSGNLRSTVLQQRRQQQILFFMAAVFLLSVSFVAAQSEEDITKEAQKLAKYFSDNVLKVTTMHTVSDTDSASVFPSQVSRIATYAERRAKEVGFTEKPSPELLKWMETLMKGLLNLGCTPDSINSAATRFEMLGKLFSDQGQKFLQDDIYKIGRCCIAVKSPGCTLVD